MSQRRCFGQHAFMIWISLFGQSFTTRRMGHLRR